MNYFLVEFVFSHCLTQFLPISVLLPTKDKGLATVEELSRQRVTSGTSAHAPVCQTYLSTEVAYLVFAMSQNT